MNHIDLARWAQRQYDELGLDPTPEPESGYERAHSPLPKSMGDETIPLHHLDHAVHDVYQSEAVGHRHFFTPDAKAALYETPSYWPPGWFEACELYEKWARYQPEEERERLRTVWVGRHHTEATKKKLSEAQQGRTSPNKGKKTGKPAWNAGKKTDPATRKKLSEANKGRTPWNKGKRRAG